MKWYSAVFVASVWIIILLISGGCGATVVSSAHPSLAQEADILAARVYFLRTDTNFLVSLSTIREPFAVFLEGQELLRIARGEYTVVHVKPYCCELVLYWDGVLTQRARRPFSKKLWDSRRFDVAFSKDETYFVLLHADDTLPAWNDPQLVILSREEAVDIAKKLKPVGEAVTHPIE